MCGIVNKPIKTSGGNVNYSFSYKAILRRANIVECLVAPLLGIRALLDLILDPEVAHTH